MRISPSPVFLAELIVGARRWWNFTQRTILISLLLCVLAAVFFTAVPLRNAKQLSLADFSSLSQNFSEAVLTTQLVLILLGAPAAVVAAVCTEAARGKLELLLATELSSTEIVLGMIGSQLVFIFSLIAASVPVLFIAGLMGGINWEFLLCGFAVLIGTTLICTTLTMAFAVGAEKPRKAIWSVYQIFFWSEISYLYVKVFGWTAVSDWMFRTNPFALLFGPTHPNWGITLADYGIYLATTVCVSVLLVALASRRLRRVVELRHHQAIQPWQPGLRATFLTSALLDRNPLRWYERHRRLSSRTKAAMFGSMGLLWAMVVFLPLIQLNSGFFPPDIFFEFASMLALIGLIWVTIDAVTGLTDERRRGNLEALLTTPFSSREILYSKWRTTSIWVPLIFIWPVLLVAIDCIEVRSSGGDVNFGVIWLLMPYILSAAAFYLCLGLFLAVWLREFSRAIGAAVALFVVMTVAWPYLVSAALGRNNETFYLISISPPAALIEMVAKSNSATPGHGMTAMLMWTALFCLGAVLLYRLTQRLFDRSFGRVSQRAG